MPRHHSREVFRPGLGLRVRMAFALLLNALLLVVLIVIAVAVVMTPDGWSVVLIFIVLAFLGAGGGRAARKRRRRHKPLEGARGDAIARRIARLCTLADLPEPATELVVDDRPLSWTTALPWRQPRVHVTSGMAALLPEAELEAVLAHELSHIGNRDATLMTVLATPGVFVLRGLRAVWHEPRSGLRVKAGLVMFGWLYVPPAAVSTALCRIVSRHRELAADRGAALLTGSPAALAAALRRLSDGLHSIPDRDLRVVAAADVFHVVPARPARGVARLWATHPPLKGRLEQLERLEARLHA
jgi:heat shock protein HtpX